MWFRLWTWFRAAREDLLLLFFAWKHPATPRYLKMMMWAALGYLISPIDFVPDYLPIVGWVDDLTVVPALLYSISRLLPHGVRMDAERRAQRVKRRFPFILSIVAVLLTAWTICVIWFFYSLLTR